MSVRKIAVRVSVVLLSLMTVLLVLEAVFRFFHLGPGQVWGFRHKDGYFKFHPYAKTDYRPAYTINNLGFRGADVSLEKDAAVTRIVTLGASSTFGYHDYDTETYPAILGQTFRPDSRIEVINLGIPYARSDHMANILKFEGIPLSPDYVTVYAGWNDANYAVYQRDMISRFTYWLIRSSEVAAWLQLRLVTMMEHFPGLTRSIGYLDAKNVERAKEIAENHFGRHIREIIRVCGERHIPVVLVTQIARPPDHGGRAGDDMRSLSWSERRELLEQELKDNGRILFFDAVFYIQSELQQLLVRIAREENARLIDGIMILDDHPEDLVSHVHLNGDGNRRLAVRLHEVLAGDIRSAGAADASR